MSAEEEAAGLALFGEDLAAPAKEGRVERWLADSILAGIEHGTIVAEDRGLAAGALVAARHLDVLDRAPTHKGAYAVAALLTPWRECLHALRLPAAVEPSDGPPAPGNADDLPEWMREFGTPG